MSMIMAQNYLLSGSDLCWSETLNEICAGGGGGYFFRRGIKTGNQYLVLKEKSNYLFDKFC